MKKTILRWWPTAIVVLIIIYATLFPDPAGADRLPVIPGIDKLIHAIMFGGLAGAIAFDYSRVNPGHLLSKSRMFVFCLIAALSGGVIELLQGAMNLGRGADILDFGADIAGVIVAWFAAPPAIAAVLRHRL